MSKVQFIRTAVAAAAANLRPLTSAFMVFKCVAGKRLLFRPLTGTSDAPPSIGIARATKGDVTPAGEKFGEILRQLTGNSSSITSVKSEDSPAEWHSWLGTSVFMCFVRGRSVLAVV